MNSTLKPGTSPLLAGTGSPYFRPACLQQRCARKSCGAVARRAVIREESETSWVGQAAAAIAAGLLILSPLSATAASDKGDVLVGPPRVVDGDTLVVAGEKIRLFGLDAPESKQSCNNSRGQPYACGQSAAEALRKKIGSSSVQCTIRAKDLYGRNVSSCSLPGTGDIGDWLVSNGYAVAYRQYSKDYVADEEAAKAAHKGIWQGSFENPADWRKENKGGKKSSGEPQTVASSASGQVAKPLASLAGNLGAATDAFKPGCEIKGNISSKGDRIYHVPGGRYYANVKIEPSKGEKMFCSEQEAESAGFRKSSV